MAAYDDVDNQSLIVIGIISTLLLLVVVLITQAVYYHMETEEVNRKIISQSPESLRRILTDQEAQLQSYRWVDKQKQTVAIPIDDAMELTVKELSQAQQKEPAK